MLAPRPATLYLVANQAWNLVNYRAGLIRALLADGWSIVACTPPEPEMQQRLAAMGCRIETIPLDARGLSPLAEARTFLALFELLRRDRPAALLSWTIKANLWGALAARLAGIPAIPNISGLGIAQDGQGVLKRVSHALYNVCLARAPTVFFQNETDRATLVDAGAIGAQQAQLLPGSGVDTGHFEPASHVRPRTRRYLLIARLLAAKGVREFVAAARIVRAERDDLRFAVVGFIDPANPAAITAKEIAAWQAEGVIEYGAPVSDVRPEFDTTEAVVLPSYYREGLSRALLEAAAMGRPIITTDHPGCREAIVPGETGFLCQPRDVASLVDAIRRMAALDEGQWTAMSRAARERICREFAEPIVVDAYRRALAEAGATAPISSRSPSASS